MTGRAVQMAGWQTEHVIGFRPTMSAFLLKSFKGWLTLAGSILLLGIPFIAVGVVALRYRMTWYELSGERLFIRQGILARTEEEIELYRIKDVRADFSIIQQLFDVGNLQIISSDLTGEGVDRRTVLRISNLENARHIRTELRNRVERARRIKGVREIDM
ncbi:MULTISPECIES: PH domain-containing protein [unclassified Sphingobium]|uniref:PH domain-containing protein n=1 Tax=unclassified Sphingobium TaxID=2611147 RepID=UPI0022256D2A|nr:MULTISPECIES: PH domain-containing protein [unclassified Sphingobium]MCW2366544.1 putative membrane protein YdbT with pleckstrin-like domain [Sphingobium sp. B7D2B]MCW2381946.1 putative membrane protein YdbT with pleckstrin-like domain [Sphingobium sp. B2D3B]MCW2397873.1 putative membrane protein YdbT with pleckstrin-like domain [Sphingobium sp. B2D3C]